MNRISILSARLPAVSCLFLAAGIALGGAVQTATGQTATALVMLDLSYFPEFVDADPDWAEFVFQEEAVGILLYPGAGGASGAALSCIVAGYEGTYVQIHAALVTRHGGVIPSVVRVNFDLDSLHGFWPTRDFEDVAFHTLAESQGVLSENQNGNWAGFFVTIGL